MTKPKYKESAAERVERLGLKKPHILWSREFGEWLYRNYRTGGEARACGAFCREQDRRWTPRSKK